MRKWLAFTTLMLLAATDAQATVPTSFSVQGVLRNSSGQLQSMAVNVLATFFDSQTGMTPLAGPFTANNVMAVNGLFTVTFSDAAIITNLAKTGTGQLWLELTVGNDTFPRQQVTPSVWSLMSATADHATASDAATTTAQLQGVNVATTAPTDQQLLQYSSANSRWQPFTPNYVDTSSNQTIGGTKQFSGAVGVGTAPVSAFTVYDGSTFNPANVGVREFAIGEISAANGFGANGWCTGGLVGPTYCMGASSGTMYWGVVNASGLAQTMRLDSAGNVLIPSGSTYGMFSSAKYKKDIHFLDQMDLEKALKLLLDTPVATFRNKAAPQETKVAYGVIAEKTPSPLLTQENDAFSMSNAVGVLMASVKAQQAHITELEARLAKLEGRKPRASRTKATAPAIPRAPAE